MLYIIYISHNNTIRQNSEQNIKLTLGWNIKLIQDQINGFYDETSTDVIMHEIINIYSRRSVDFLGWHYDKFVYQNSSERTIKIHQMDMSRCLSRTQSTRQDNKQR